MNGIILYQSKYGTTKNTRSGFQRKQAFPVSKQSRQEFLMSGNMTPSFSAGESMRRVSPVYLS